MESKCQKDSTVQHDEDQALWLSLKSGDSSALDQLFNNYYEKLYFYGLKLIGDHNRVADAIQDLFANIWEMRQGLSEVTYVKAYLFAILRYDLLKPNSKIILDRPNTDDSLNDHNFTISPEELYINQESQSEGVRIIEDLLANLSAKQKEIIYLKFYNNYSNTEISCVLSIKPQSVANLLARTINRLRKNKNGSISTNKTSIIDS
jgi:RNA polymerase sigma-70 factor (ECF subfamily)